MTAYGISIAVSLLVQWVCLTLPVYRTSVRYTGSINHFYTPADQTDILRVPKTEDFTVIGTGSHPVWQSIEWQPMVKLDEGGEDYSSKFKICYSNTGIYVLFSGEDQRITSEYDEDFGELWNGDVFEVFFHPESAVPMSPYKSRTAASYAEYEINALGKELVLFIDRESDSSQSRYPDRYEGDRRVKKAVHVSKVPDGTEGRIEGWSAEIYFPFSLLAEGIHAVPGSGAVWRANFCRIDYDTGNQIKWSWTPTIKKSFHELTSFLRIQFE